MRDKSVHLEVIRMVISFAVANGFKVLNLEYSPIKGPEGNIEYLLHIQKLSPGEEPQTAETVPVDPAGVVEAAHGQLD